MKMSVPEYSGGGAGAASLADDLRTVVRAFACRWPLIAVIVLLFAAAGLATVWVSPRAYTSTVSVFIDPRERNLVDLGVAPTGLGSSSQGADGALVDSQIAILTSRSVLGALVTQMRLDEDPGFTAVATGLSATLRGVIASTIYGPSYSRAAALPAFDRAILSLERKVEVKRVGNTYVIDIAVTTGSPDKSAELANALAGIYLNNGQNTVDDSAREQASSLEARLSELGRTSEASQQAVEAYRRDNGLIGSQGVLLSERQLSDLSSQLVTASVAVEAARTTLDTLQSSGSASSTSNLLADLRVRIGQARADENMLADTYGPRHPRLVRARETRKALEATLNAELARVVASAEADYENAVRQEAALKGRLAEAQETLTRSNSASIKLRELEETARRDRELYDTFATKAKQAREQVSLPTTNARVISEARPSTRPSEPKALLIIAASLFLGAVTGFGVAWLLYILVGPPARRPRRMLPFSRRHLVPAE